MTRSRRGPVLLAAALALAACSSGDDESSPSSAPETSTSASPSASATSSSASAATTTDAVRPKKPKRPRGSTTVPTTAPATTTTTAAKPPSPHALVVRDVCAKVRSNTYLANKRVIRRGQQRFTAQGGEAYIHTRLQRRCAGAMTRFARLDSIANDADLVIDEITEGPGFLEALGCTADGMIVQITNRTDRTIGALLVGSFGGGERARQGGPPLVVWRLDPGQTRRLTVPTGPRVGRYDGLCSATAIPWLARERPAVTALYPVRPGGRADPLKGVARRGVPISVRSLYRNSDAFQCGGDRELLQGVTDLRSGSFDRKRSEPRCVREERKIRVCRNIARSGRYAAIEVKLSAVRVKIGDKVRVAPRQLVVGVARQSPSDGRWRWLVEPQQVARGDGVACSGIAAFPVGSAPG